MNSLSDGFMRGCEEQQHAMQTQVFGLQQEDGPRSKAATGKGADDESAAEPAVTALASRTAENSAMLAWCFKGPWTCRWRLSVHRTLSRWNAL